MSKTCDMLTEWNNRINAGEDPEEVIPYEISCADPEMLADIYYYCIQVLRDPVRIECCRKNLQEVMKNESW